MERRRGNMQFAMYALHLATGNTLFCRCIKTATIKKYLLHVASLFWLFGPQQRDFRKSNNNDSGFTPELTKLYCELDRWETVPNRREPFTLEMLHELYSWASKSNVSLDSFLAAFQDWFTIGLFAGLVKSDWNSKAGASAMGAQQRNIFQDTQAFCVNNCHFEMSNGARLIGLDVLATPSELVTKLRITFRTQKSGDNRQKNSSLVIPTPKAVVVFELLFKFLSTFSVSDQNVSADSYLAALQDWFTIGLFAGLRKSEWAQDAGASDVGSPQLNRNITESVHSAIS
jgi:hypothetical protein